MVTDSKYDLLLKNGHVIDPKNGIDSQMDVAVKDGKITAIGDHIPAGDALKTVDVSGLYVTPGLIDMHAHVFWGADPEGMYSGGPNGVPPDGFTFRAGVTTIVDAGSSGRKNFIEFKDRVIDKAKTRVLGFLNIVGSGMKGRAIEQNLDDMDPVKTAETANKYGEVIVGIKLAHYVGHDYTPAKRAVKAGQQAGKPVMIDFGEATPPLSIKTLFMDILRPGDIFTHCYANLPIRESVVDENFNLKPFIPEARKKGIIFDVGHGEASFNFHTAMNAIKQGLKPDSISTDLHITNMNAGMKDMANLMSKFLNIGMTLPEVIAASTWAPAQEIKHPELGHLSEGAAADITVLRLEEGHFGFVDAKPGVRVDGNIKLTAELTVRGGDIVWDLNGISAPLFG